MKKAFLTILMLCFMVSSVFACYGDDCTIETPDFIATIDNSVVINGMTFEGVTDTYGCNDNGLYESSRVYVVGSSAGVTATQEITTTGRACYDCVSAVAGSMIAFDGYTDIAGRVHTYNADASYQGVLHFEGVTIVGVGNFY